MYKYAIETFYSEKDMGYIAVVPELAGCSVFSETEEEALKEVTAATELWLETAEKEWRGIPQPAGKELLKAFVEEKIDSEIREMGEIGGVIAVRFAPVPMRIETHQFDCIGVRIRIRDGYSNFVPLILFKL